MSRQRYPEEFKIEAVKQVIEKGKPVAEVAQRLGMSIIPSVDTAVLCSCLQ